MLDSESFNPTVFHVGVLPTENKGMRLSMIAMDSESKVWGRAVSIVWEDRGEPGTYVPPFVCLDPFGAELFMESLGSSIREFKNALREVDEGED